MNQSKTVKETEPVGENSSELVKEDRLVTELVTAQNVEPEDTSETNVIEPVSEIVADEAISQSTINLKSDAIDEVSDTNVEVKDKNTKIENVIAHGQIEQSREENSGSEESDLEGNIELL